MIELFSVELNTPSLELAYDRVPRDFEGIGYPFEVRLLDSYMTEYIDDERRFTFVFEIRKV